MFTISLFLIFLAYIFSESIFLKYHCTFSLYKVIDFTIEESLHPSNEIFYKYQLPLPDLLGTTIVIGNLPYHSSPVITY